MRKRVINAAEEPVRQTYMLLRSLRTCTGGHEVIVSELMCDTAALKINLPPLHNLNQIWWKNTV